MNVFVLWTFQTASKIGDDSNITAIEHLIEVIYFHCFASCTPSCVHEGVNENVLT